jgi:hypothetical protein
VQHSVPGVDLVEITLSKSVIVRLVRATHLLCAAKLGRPHEAGDDEFWVIH